MEQQGMFFEFNQLSSEMKEQLNAAVRIAIAITLKDQNGEC